MGESLPWGNQIAVKKIIFTDYMENHNSKQYLQSVWLLGESQHQTVLAICMITWRIAILNNTCNLYDYLESHNMGNHNIKQNLQSVWLNGESQQQTILAICMSSMKENILIKLLESFGNGTNVNSLLYG